MNKTIAITAIVLVAVVMGMSAVAPMIPQAEALPDRACDAVLEAVKRVRAENRPDALLELKEHCETVHA